MFGCLRCEQLRQLVLRDVRVLELVDQHVQHALLVLLADLLVMPQHLHRADDEVVEVERAVLDEQPLVVVVDARDDLAEVVARLLRVRLRRHQLALRVRDGAEDRALLEALGVDVRALARPLHQRHLVAVVVDVELPVQADAVGLGTQQPRADRVERAQQQVGRGLAEVRRDARPHLARRLVRERHREDPPRRDPDHIHQVRDAMGDHARLAGAWPGEDQQRAPRSSSRPRAEADSGLRVCARQ